MLVKSFFRAALLALVAGASFASDPVIGPWIPKFKGVDVSVSTNFPGERFPVLEVMTAIRVDLTDPDIRLLATPRRADYVAGSKEVSGLTVSDFLRTNHLQMAVNANFFDLDGNYLPAGYPMDIYGLEISEGVVVSEADRTHAACLMFDAANMPAFVPTNWPALSTEGIYTAVSGDLALVVGGKNVVSTNRRLDRAPRTAFGISQDRRYLYLMGIDGRQPGYSEGATDPETAEWLLLLGASDGINLDGGGSTTLVMASSTGEPVLLNKPSAVADFRERTIASHLGIFARPLEGFFKNVAVAINDISATVTWETEAPAISKVLYGPDESLGSAAMAFGTGTNHVVGLAQLTPATHYFYQLVADDQVSPVFAFTTTNYVTTNFVFGLTNNWRYSTDAFADQDWTSAAYDDANWSEPGPGLLWVNNRGSNEDVQPASTELPLDPATGYPYITYFFRTHFNLPNLVADSSLALSGYVDDGLVLYLNGAEIWRLRVPEGASAGTLASGYPCAGDATCLDAVVVPASALSSLKSGDNVLAAEVHNYNPRSGDITFGLSADLIVPAAKAPALTIESSGGQIVLRWEGAAYRLQMADSPAGAWTDTTMSSPAVITLGESRRFFRLAR